MKKRNSHNEQLDKAFREGLNDFQVPSPAFGKPDTRTEVDHQLSAKIDAFEVEPDRKNWEKISRRIPLSLKLHRQLNFWSKVAAVLVVGMIGTLVYSNMNEVEQGSGVVLDQIEEEVIPQEPVDNIIEFVERKDTEKDDIREAFIDEDYAQPRKSIELLEPLESKPPTTIADSDNILNETIQRDSDAAVKMEKRKQAPVKEVLLGDVKQTVKTGEQKNN